MNGINYRKARDIAKYGQKSADDIVYLLTEAALDELQGTAVDKVALLEKVTALSVKSAAEMAEAVAYVTAHILV